MQAQSYFAAIFRVPEMRQNWLGVRVKSLNSTGSEMFVFADFKIKSKTRL